MRVEEIQILAAEVLAPPPDLTVSEWADANRRLSSESAAEKGEWRTDRAPYQRAVMDAMGPASPFETVVMMWAALQGLRHRGRYQWRGGASAEAGVAMGSVRVYQKKQLRLDLLNFKQRQMYELGSVGVATVKERLAASQGPEDSQPSRSARVTPSGRPSRGRGTAATSRSRAACYGTSRFVR